MELAIRAGTPSDQQRYLKLYWVGPKDTAHDVAVRLDSRDNKWYVTDRLTVSTYVVAGPFETKEAAQATAEMLWFAGVFTQRKEK